MKKITLSIVCFVSVACFCQQPDSVEAWKVSIKVYGIPVEHIDSVYGGVFKSITYYIRGGFILKKEEPTTLINPGKTTVTGNIRTTMTAQVINAVYLIDFDNKVAYTYCKEKETGKKYAVVDSLKNHFDDILYKAMAVDTSRNKFKIIDSSAESAVDVAGFRVYNALAATTTLDAVTKQPTIVPIKYNKMSLPFKSPLNALYPEFPYDIYSICFPGNPKKGQQMCFTISGIQKMNVPASFFEVPDAAILRRNLTLAEFVKDWTDPFIK